MSASVNPSTKEISLTRGDSLILNFTITKNEEEYVPVQGDAVRFALKQTIPDDEPLILKDADITNQTIELLPSDTKQLAFGTYVYDIQLTTVDGYVDTFIGPATFRITEEVW